MNRSIGLPRKRVLAALASLAGLATALLVAGAPAQAACSGGGSPDQIYRYYNGNLVAHERAISTTCDGDGVYLGQIRDPFTDGYSARAQYRDGSYTGIQGISGGGWVNYRFYDQTGNSSAQLRIYSSPASAGSYWNTWGY